MNILNRRTYVVEYYRVYFHEGKFDSKIFVTSFLKAYCAIIFHIICNFFTRDRICCRIIGRYVR